MSCAKPPKTQIVVCAASSMIEPLGEIAQKFSKTKQGENIEILFSFGSSGSLQKQIENGAPCDLFVSASEEQIRLLGSLLALETKTVLAKNSLVFVVPKQNEKNIKSFEDLFVLPNAKIGMGDFGFVPLGQYCEQALKNYGVFEKLEKNFVFAPDAQTVASWAQTQAVDCAIIYHSDAVLRKNDIEIVFQIEQTKHDPITYPVAVVRSTQNFEASNLFLKYLVENKAVFEEHGFY